MHENQPYPPFLSEFRKLRFGKRSDLLTCVKPARTEQPNPPPFYDCKIFDKAAVTHALPSTTVSTFDSYAENVFISFILNHLQSSNRVDIVWDTYKANSIKDSTRDQDSSKLEHVSAGKYKQERTLCVPDKQSFKLLVSWEQGSKHHLRRSSDQYAEMRPRRSRHKNCCTCSTRAGQRLQARFLSEQWIRMCSSY